LARKADENTVLLKEILAELRRLNANLERRAAPPEMPMDAAGEDSEDMDDFE
jgi:hypothetical protein